MRFGLFLVFAVVSISLAACGVEQAVKDPEEIKRVGNMVSGTSSGDEQFPIQGFIIFVKDSERYVLIRDEDFHQEDSNLSLKEIQGKYRDIMFLNLECPVPNNLKSGQKVAIGVSKILESYPPRVFVNEIIIVENR